jgi:hypothetical protein
LFTSLETMNQETVRQPTHLLQRLLAHLEADSSLFEPKWLRKRIDALDELDGYFSDADAGVLAVTPNRALTNERVRAIRIRLEAANSAIYESIRNEVQRGVEPSELRRWIRLCGGQSGIPSPGLGYDQLDELMSGVFQIREPGGSVNHLGPEMVFYQPTPARHTLRLLRVSALSKADVLVDLGSGLGHVPMLAHLLTGARSIGVEAEAAYVASARGSAERLGLRQVTFVQQDARKADLSTGTVFYLYTPFIGAILRTVLRHLRKQSANRTLRVCTLGPCTRVVAKESWLNASATPDEGQITCFRTGV